MHKISDAEVVGFEAGDLRKLLADQDAKLTKIEASFEKLTKLVEQAEADHAEIVEELLDRLPTRRR